MTTRMEDEEVYDGDEEQLRKRFEAHLPTYGILWRSINQVSRNRLQLPEPQATVHNKENVMPPNTNHNLLEPPTTLVVSSSKSPTNLSKRSGSNQTNPTTQSFLPAILGKQTITMKVHNNNSTNENNCCEEDGLCDGLCADPIFEEETPTKQNDWNSPTMSDNGKNASTYPLAETPYRTKNELESSMDGSSPAASSSRASLPSSPDSSFCPSSEGGDTVINLSRLMITQPEEEEDPPKRHDDKPNDIVINNTTSEKAIASDIGEDSSPMSTPRNNLTPNHFTPSSNIHSRDNDDDVASSSGSTAMHLSHLMNSTGKHAPIGGNTGSLVGSACSPISHSSSSSSSGDSVLDLSAYFPTMEETELAMKEPLTDELQTQGNDVSEHLPEDSPLVPSFGAKEGQYKKLDSHVEFGVDLNDSDDGTEKKSMSSPFHNTTSLLLGSPLSMDEIEHEGYHNSNDENEPISSPQRVKDSTSSKHDNDEQSTIGFPSLGKKEDKETSQNIESNLCENEKEGDSKSSAKREHASCYRNTHTIENLSTSEEEWSENSIRSEADSVHSEKKEFSVIILSDDESEEDSILMDEDDSSWDGSFHKTNDSSFNDSTRSQIVGGIDLKKNDIISIDLETSDNDASESEFQSTRRKERPKRNKRKTARTSIEYIESDDDNDDMFDTCRKKDTEKKRRKAQPPPRRKRTEKEHKTTSKESKATFSRERDSLTKEIFSEFDRRAFDKSLSAVEVTWSKRLTTTAGITRLKSLTLSGTQQRVATIELSTKIIDDSERLRATLLHEMCHAAAWLVDGTHKPPHGQCFKKWANISMKRIKDVTVSITHDYQISYKYAWACVTPNCGVVIKRHSRSLDIKRKCCGRCQGRLVEIEVPSSSADNKSKNSWVHTPKKKRAPSGFSLFIKEHSKSVRQRLEEERDQSGGTKVTQPTVMKECGRLWREQQQKPPKDASSALEKDSGTITIQDLLSQLNVHD